MTLRGDSNAKWKEISGKKGCSSVTFQVLRCCNKEVKQGEVWILQDYNGFDARKMYVGKCPVCEDDVVFLYQRRIEDGAQYGTPLTGIEAVKTIYREKKRIISKTPKIQSSQVQEWIYGTNIQIKSKTGKVIKIRQYSTDYKTGEKVLVKEIQNT